MLPPSGSLVPLGVFGPVVPPRGQLGFAAFVFLLLTARSRTASRPAGPGTMGKTPIRLKEVVYTLSPFQQSVMSGLWKDLPHKAAHHAANVSARRRCRFTLAAFTARVLQA